MDGFVSLLSNLSGAASVGFYNTTQDLPLPA